MKDFILRINPKLLKIAQRSTDKAVLMAMLIFSDNGNGECFASHVSIGKVAGCNDKTVTKSIKRTNIFEVIDTRPLQGFRKINVYKARTEYEVLLNISPKARTSSELPITIRHEARTDSELKGRSSELGTSPSGVKLGLSTVKTRNNKKEQFSEISSLSNEMVFKTATEFNITPKTVRGIVEELKDYCKSTGKTYKNYPFTLRSWIRRKKSNGEIRELTEEEQLLADLRETERKQLEIKQQR